MPSLEQPTASSEEGPYIYAKEKEHFYVQPLNPNLSYTPYSPAQHNQAEWSSYEEEQSTPSASMAYRGEIFAFSAAASVSEYNYLPPKTIA